MALLIDFSLFYRFCPSLPRRSIPQSESQFTDNSIHYEEAKPISLYQDSTIRSTAHQSTQTMTMPNQTLYKSHVENIYQAPEHTGHPVKQDYRSHQTSSSKHNDLDFYTNNSWASSQYTKEHRLTDHYNRKAATHRTTKHHTTSRSRRPHESYQYSNQLDKANDHYQQLPSAAYSEDEGIALHCESLSSGSHYAEHTDRTLDSCYKPMYNNNGMPSKELNVDINLDYTKYSWDKFDDRNKYSAYSTHITSINTPHSTCK